MRARWVLAAVVVLGGPARADDPPPPVAPEDYAELTDDELIALAQGQGELIVVWDERPDKPFDRDTTLRLTDTDLEGRGVSHLGDALALVPELLINSAGRGGETVFIRGGHKGAIRVLVDGIPLEDPFYGTFDLSTVPVTDVVQVRVSTSPASPIDGPGGPAGVIEVHTRDAVGERAIVGRASADSRPTAAISATGRGDVAADWGARVSVSGTLGDHAYTVPGGELDEDRRFGGAAARAEWRPHGQDVRRAVLDVAGFSSSFVVPPAEDDAAVVTVIDRERGGRATAAYEDLFRGLQLIARGHASVDYRLTRYFADASLDTQSNLEDLAADRAGLALLVHRPVGRTMRAVVAAHLDSDHARVEDAAAMVTTGRSTIGELAAGWQLERGALRVDAAVGLGVPLGVGEAPWPEAKLVAAVTPIRGVTFRATGARKGRLPTLRERYGVGTGNDALDPEQTSFGEAKIEIALTPRARAEVASWARRQDGLIQRDLATGVLGNVGVVDFIGFDARVDITPIERVTVTGAWSFITADDATFEEPVDFLPANRVFGQVRGGPWRGVTATARVQWVDDRIDRGVVLAPYADWQAELMWSPNRRWLISARGEDLLDRRWELHPGVPAAGRTVMLGLQLETP